MEWEVVQSVLLGVALAAACGFRAFVPFLVISIAAHAGHVTLSAGFAWIGTWPALLAFAVATALEIAAYYIPWLDNLLDSVATPAAVVAGIVITASCITGMSPMLKWTLAVIAGGGAAAITQGATVVTRAVSTATTGGIANPAVSTCEAGGSVAVSLLAVLVPVIAAALVVGGLSYGVSKIVRRLRGGPARDAPAGAEAPG